MGLYDPNTASLSAAEAKLGDWTSLSEKEKQM